MVLCVECAAVESLMDEGTRFRDRESRVSICDGNKKMVMRQLDGSTAELSIVLRSGSTNISRARSDDRISGE